MLWKLNTIQITLAIAPSKTERTMVKMMEAVMFSSKRSDLLNSGDMVPMWRCVLNLEPKDPKMFPLIPIAPGMITIRPG